MFEDFEIGDRFRTGTVEVDAESIRRFAAEYDPQRIHLDEQYAQRSFFGELVGSGWHVAALTMKLMVDAKVLGDTQIIGGEVDCLRFLDPLRAGDRLQVEAMVIGKRRSTASGRGYITLALTTRNEDGTPMLTMLWKLIVPTAVQCEKEAAQPGLKSTSYE